MVEINIQGIEILPEGKVKINELILETIRQQTSKGISSTGEQTKLDWKESGRLLSDVTVSESGVNFNAPYAGYVNDKHPFAGIAPQSMSEFNRKLSIILNQYSRFI